MSPRFIYMGEGAQAAAQFDLTWVIAAVMAVSVAMTGAVRLFIGAKEYRFFPN
jgi:hypothetical protein